MGYRRARGLRYLRFLNHIHRHNLFDWYLEIGCRFGTSAAACRGKTILVDPYFQVETNIIKNKPRLHIVQDTSDAFFNSGMLSALDIRLSFSFLDGMHLIEYLLRDFINAEAHSDRNGVIAMHDCCPWTSEMTSRDVDSAPDDSPWTGDVWKIIPILRKYRPDLTVQVLDCKPSGLVVVTDLSPDDTTLRDNYDAILSEYQNLSIDTYGPARFYSGFEYVSASQVIEDGCKFLDGVRLDTKQVQDPSFISP